MAEQLLIAAISPFPSQELRISFEFKRQSGLTLTDRDYSEEGVLEYLPCKVGFPVSEILFAPMHTSSPMPSSPGAVWLTITVPKAPKGQGETNCDRAALACRIQYARVLKGMLLIDSVGLPIGACCANVPDMR